MSCTNPWENDWKSGKIQGKIREKSGNLHITFWWSPWLVCHISLPIRIARRSWPCLTLFWLCPNSANVIKTGLKKDNSETLFSQPIFVVLGRELLAKFSILYPNFRRFHQHEIFGLVLFWISCHSNSAPSFPVIRKARNSMTLYDPNFLWSEWREAQWPYMTLIFCDPNGAKLNDLVWP